MNVALLKQSFAMVAPLKEEFAHSFYTLLFARYPQTQPLFAHADMKRQEAALVGAIAYVVAGVERGDDLAPVLQELGKKHKAYGAIPAHYPLVGGVLLETFQQYLGSAFTAEVQQTWAEAYAIITTQMLIGADDLLA